MLIRVSGYNDGGKEYLEEGQKNGRELSREELDERVILDGDLDLTQMVYQQIPDKGQERYATFTLSFREDEISNETLLAVTKEFKEFLMYAYEDDEYNFYAEAHLPKIKETLDKKTGEKIERKPHIHIFIPRKNLLSGKEMNPRGMLDSNVKYFEAFQEYINQKYTLASPREHVRVDPTSVADVLSRYKGDDFRSKNQEFKKQLVTEVIEKNITSRSSFYQHVSQFGDTRIRNAGKDNEYIAVKLPGDAKFTNLKESIFHDDFIVRRELKKAPLDKSVIRERLLEWPQRAKEIKYVSKATPKFRQLYKEANADKKIDMLAQRQQDFYDKNRGRYELHPAKWQRDNQRSLNEVESGRVTSSSYGVQSLSSGNVAVDRQGGKAERAVLLPGNAYFRLGQQDPGGNPGLRYDLRSGGRKRGDRDSKQHDFDKYSRVRSIPSVTAAAERHGRRLRGGIGGGDAESLNIPPHALNPHKVASIGDIQKRSKRLFAKSGRGDEPTRVRPIHRLMPKSDKKASFVAAYFLRRHENNIMKPSQRREIRAVDKQFFDTRREIMIDSRLTRTEKNQYISVLTFERLKAHQAIKKPNIPFELENRDMGSEDIRNFIKSKRIPDNSISGSADTDKAPKNAKQRFSQLIKNVNEHMAEQRTRDRQRTISANDLYTKRAKLSQNIHYLDKKTDRTMFVDTGKAITLRKSGMTASAVLVALELAKEKFGSTLTINGSKQFKDQVIEAVAKNNLDVHFTDKAMNQRLAERKEELAIERSGNTVEMPETKSAAEKMPTTRDEFKAAFTNIEQRYEDIIARSSDMTSQEISHLRQPLMKELDALADSYIDQSGGDEYERLNAKSEKLAYDLTEIEQSKALAEGNTQTTKTQTTKGHVGELLEHGAAPYKFKPDLNKPEDERDDSYYVTLRDESGNSRTLWGVGLEDAVAGLKIGERIKLEDKGVESVSWTENRSDGSTVQKSGERRTWEGSPVDREHDHDGPGVA